MKKLSVSLVAVCMVVAVAGARGELYDTSVRLSLDPDSSDDSRIATVVAGGFRISPETTVGLYGSYQSTDRTHPARMDYFLGAGVYGEFGPDEPDFFLLPFAGVGVGFLDPSGVGGQTMVHLQGYVGARFPIHPGWFVTTAATLHWVDSDFFDAKANGRGNVSADRTDLTFDLGLLYRF